MARRDCDGAWSGRSEAVPVGKRLGAVDAHSSHPQGHRHGTIIGRATVPHAVAVCDAGALGYSIRHSPGDVCVVAMRAESFVACDAGAGQSPEPPTGTASRRDRQCAMSFAPRGEGWAIGRR